MKIQESDILRTLISESFINQRILSEASGHSLGVVNKSVRALIEAGYLNDSVQLTQKAQQEIRTKAPKNAIILAAGFGMRMVPINLTTPKALLEINGERLIDRLIRQLHEVGIAEIYVVTGFMKELFEYLIDEYGVELIVNENYAGRNNLYSLSLALEHLSNTYIVPCDIWCDNNPFRKHELYSWYMVSDLIDDESNVRVNRKMELITVNDSKAGNEMIGISYLLEPEAEKVRKRILELNKDTRYEDSFWEEALFQREKHRMIVAARVVHASDVVEINTYEQLRELDSNSNQLKSDAISVIAQTFKVHTNEITGISVLKKGMTNRSFLFAVHEKKYIMRIPGEGTERLINRRQEAAVFSVIGGKGLCSVPLYMNVENGYKITAFLEGVRVCDSNDITDLERCMEMLRAFHSMKLKVDHTFDIFARIEFYESLWGGAASVYHDYQKTKEKVKTLKKYIDGQKKDWCLTHIDAVPDNFLFYRGEEGKEELQLIDWEYSGMQDPHVDIAMFCIYSLYNKQQVDRLIDIYFQKQCDDRTRIKIYCYIAACGLLWSNWCEYKQKLGIEFGRYSLCQYRYAKDYYRYATEEMNKAAVKTMHTIKRAVIMAAGIGKRLRPITLTTPKPLIKVNGVRMIDTIIQGLYANHITEIYVVVGYLKEQFKVLEEEYKGLKLIENPFYNTCNNISSLYAARDYIEDAIILDGDQIIYNPAVLAAEFEHSGYNSIWTESETSEWLQTVENGIVTSCSRTGGKGGWQLYSVSRWTAEDGRRLKAHLELEFEKKKNRQIYWDDVAMFCHKEDYQFGIWPMKAGDIIEVDSLIELAALDQSYQKYITGGYKNE